jgi:hypothetical protein
VTKFEADYAKFQRLREQVKASGIHRYEDLSLLTMLADGRQLIEKYPDRQEKLIQWRAMVSEIEAAKIARGDKVSAP